MTRRSPRCCPLAHLAEAGLDPGAAFAVRRFDVMVGKHGDHVGGERDAVRALVAGEADAACVIDGNHLAVRQGGHHRRLAVRVLARTAPYDHCTMTVLDDVDHGDRRPLRRAAAVDVVRRPRGAAPARARGAAGVATRAARAGYAPLEQAVDRLGFYGPDGSILADGYPR